MPTASRNASTSSPGPWSWRGDSLMTHRRHQDPKHPHRRTVEPDAGLLQTATLWISAAVAAALVAGVIAATVYEANGPKTVIHHSVPTPVAAVPVAPPPAGIIISPPPVIAPAPLPAAPVMPPAPEPPVAHQKIQTPLPIHHRHHHLARRVHAHRQQKRDRLQVEVRHHHPAEQRRSGEDRGCQFYPSPFRRCEAILIRRFDRGWRH